MNFKPSMITRLPADWIATGPSHEELASLTDEMPGTGVFLGMSASPKGDESSTSASVHDSMAGSDVEEEVKVISLPVFRSIGMSGESFGAMQEWEGIVTEIESDVFRAELIDLTAGEVEPNEFAEIPIADVQSEDMQRLKVGATFRWLVGYAKSATGTKTRGVRIHFREPPALEDEAEIPNLKFDDDISPTSTPSV